MTQTCPASIQVLSQLDEVLNVEFGRVIFYKTNGMGRPTFILYASPCNLRSRPPHCKVPKSRSSLRCPRELLRDIQLSGSSNDPVEAGVFKFDSYWDLEIRMLVSKAVHQKVTFTLWNILAS